MKAKIFISNAVGELERNINSWLGKHPEILICYVTQSQDAGTDELVGNITITIWYEEKHAREELEKL